MASLYKKPIVITDPKTGKKIKTKSKKWWGRFRNHRGFEKRVPLARDKTAAKAMLDELIKKEELRAAGRFDPCEEHSQTPLEKHIDGFEKHLQYKGDSAQHVFEVASRVKKIAKACGWKSLQDIDPNDVQRYLAARRETGLSRQTSNHYLRAIKGFSRWLARDQRIPSDPLLNIAMLNVKVDRRHDRRALSTEEFDRLVDAAMTGPDIVCISGPDRAMMYILSAWTGYRKSEIGSLAKHSFRLDGDPPTVTVAACYSKRRRQDIQVLHPEVASRLREWFKTKKLLPDNALLFPISDHVPGGVNRLTSKMMKLDLKAARKKWIEEVKSKTDRAEREKTDFLKYKNDAGLFADFHSNRHTFITNLERSGVSPRRAQSLARHSDIRLTMGVYTHINLHDQSSAIESLPAPPGVKINGKAKAAKSTGSELDAMWGNLSEEIKARILTLAGAAAK